MALLSIAIVLLFLFIIIKIICKLIKATVRFIFCFPVLAIVLFVLALLFFF